MTIRLIVNGNDGLVPEGTQNLEDLLVFTKKNGIPREEIVLEVRVDGKTYSEKYPNEARELSLDEVQEVEILSQNREEFARDFLRESPAYVGEIAEGFKASSAFFRTPTEEAKGQEMLLMSLDSLQKFKVHFDQVRYALRRVDGIEGFESFWAGFASLAERIVASQENRDLPGLADLIDGHLLPLLEAWRIKLATAVSI
jgi:hypothetical protein